MKRPSLSIGIEEEYQTIDPETRDLRSHIQSEILPKAILSTNSRAKAEMHQAVIEVGTKVCRDMEEARADILELRREMITLADEQRPAAGRCQHSSLRGLEGAGDLP